MQEGMLFHTLLAPASGIYLMQNRYRLEGALDERAFVAAWRGVVQRHAMLRTAFVWKTQKRPLQVVHKQVELPFAVSDLRALSTARQDCQIASELRRELASGFDLGRPPTCFRLYRLAEQRYEFVHSFHHIVLDEWCTSLLMMDFTTLYEAERSGRPAALPPVRPYRDYVDWLAQRDPVATEAFWRAYLSGFDTPTQLGIEQPAAQSRGEVVDLVSRLDATATERLGALVKQHRLTLNTIVQGAWALLLARYSGQSDVVFGVTVSGRPPELPEVDTIVGLFINTLPLRVDVAGEQALLPWLRGLLQQNLTLRQYEHTPLVDIQRWSALPRGQDLFGSLFVFENAPIDPALRRMQSFRVEAVQDRVHTNYAATVMAWPDEQLGLKLSYDPARIAPAVAERMLAHLRTLLEGMASRPDCRLAELTLLTEAERVGALVAWNDTGTDEAAFCSYAARLQAQVARTPHAIAACCGEQTLSYAELDRRANRVAHALRAQGVQTDDRVALIDDRGLALLTMIVGVLKAGAAYVPLEPGYPTRRLEHILRVSGAKLALTREALRARLEDALAPLGAAVALLTLEDVAAAELSELAPPDHAHPDALAYVIFTSGSTGLPKGAMVHQRGMLNNMLTKIPRLGLSAGDVIAQTASQCFDISVWQHLTALLFGGRVEIVEDDIARDPERLLTYVEQRRISVLEVVPGVLAGVLEAQRARPTPARLQALRWVMPTGEALPVALARAWLTELPQIPLLNAYGPAECADDVALHEVREPPSGDARSMPIGRPVEQLRLYLLDPWLAPLPVGVTGELYVGGVGVGRGYLADPRQTAAVFVPDPWGGRGARLYRTGDRARQRDDGSFEFVGRTDHQVKLRGLRIELGEIEACLREQPSIADAVVVVREDRPGAQRLVAYVVERGEPTAPVELAQQLAQRLPRYMIPQHFVHASALPRSANGKLDRHALPAPELDQHPRFIAPRDDDERALAAIWQEVLASEAAISVEESFYARGGHSLQLTQVLARVRRVFSLEVSLRALFEAPTIAEQARVIAAERARADERRRPVPTPDPAAPKPLSFAQERLWFLAQLEPTAASYNVPAAMRLLGELDHEALAAAWSSLIARHEALRTRFVAVPTEAQGEGPRVLALIEPPSEVPLERIDLRSIEDAARERELQRALELHAARPFDLTAAPLFRVQLLQLGEREHVLSVVLHHAISDGWSMGVLVRDLTELYASFRAARPARLAPLPLQYTDYARWQRSWLGAGELDRQLAYFRARLGSDLPVLELPTDEPRPRERSYRGARHAFVIDPALTEAVRRFAARSEATPFMVLLAAFEVWLGQLSGQRAFGVGIPIANRTDESFEGLIGFFANTLVLRAELGGEPTFQSLLARVREELLGAQQHQDLPFERLVQALRPARDLGHTPLFQTLFSLQELSPEIIEVAGLSLASLEVDPKSAQFDLSLQLLLEPDALRGSFEYSTDLFAPETLAHFAQTLQTVLARLLGEPLRPLRELDLPRFAKKTFALVAALPAAELTAAPEREATLAQIWAAVLGREQVDPDANFFELGGDSILSLDVVSRARRAGVRITARQMFQYQTLRELAAAAARTTADDDGDPEHVVGTMPLLPIQQRFFARGLVNPSHWNQTLLLATDEPLAPGALEAAFRALLTQHDALRLRFTREAGEVRASYADADDAPIVHHTDLRALPAASRAQVLEGHSARWQASLDLATGPLLRAVHFSLGEGEGDRLLIVVHHLVVDGVSWRVLLDDLEQAYEQALDARPITLADKTSSLKRWGERLAQAAVAPAFVRESECWLRLPWADTARLPLDDEQGDRTEQALASHDFALDESETRTLLEQTGQAYRMRSDEVLLTALALALARYTGQAAVAIEVEGHGRETFEHESLALERTVGWLTSAYPVVLALDPHASEGSALVAVKEQLRALPRHGLPYGVVRELGRGESARALRALPTPQVAFNYLGQWDGVLGEAARFRLAKESSGPEHDPRSELPYELELDAAVHAKRLEVSFRFSRARLYAPTVERIAGLFRQSLQQLIAHCAADGAGAYSPSDFPDVVLSASDLDAILEHVD
jgi:amino acid adenylation domain-containing protein/non-ribosomal peptide synthase protein (TIGR01720 family)